jgi:hypothetical protein
VPMATIRRVEKPTIKNKRGVAFVLELHTKDVRVLSFEFPDEVTRDRVYQVRDAGACTVACVAVWCGGVAVWRCGGICGGARRCCVGALLLCIRGRYAVPMSVRPLLVALLGVGALLQQSLLWSSSRCWLLSWRSRRISAGHHEERVPAVHPLRVRLHLPACVAVCACPRCCGATRLGRLQRLPRAAGACLLLSSSLCVTAPPCHLCARLCVIASLSCRISVVLCCPSHVVVALTVFVLTRRAAHRCAGRGVARHWRGTVSRVRREP